MTTKKPASRPAASRPAPRPQRAAALDLGVLQSQMEAAARQLKVTTSALLRASEANVRAESEYDVAKKALAAGVAQLSAATKVG